MNEVDHYGKIIWDYMLMHQTLTPMDAVFALGSTDTRVAERAAELFLEGYGKYLIVAGNHGGAHGKQVVFDKPEARMFADIALKKGVPQNKIILEERSTNTGENVLFVKKIIEELKLPIHSFVLVQKPYMERRTLATFRKQWPDATCVVTSPNVSYEEYAADEHYKGRWIDLMVGDLQRIKEYPALGFQIHQDIPEEVWAAYERLVSLGYTKYLMKT